MRAGRAAGRASARRWATTGALLALVGTVPACSPDVPDARPAAERLATALETGDFTDVPLAADAPAPAELATTRTAVVEGLGEATASVEVGDVALADERTTATVPLTVTWDLPWVEEDWTYTATAHLVRDPEAEDQEWRATWDLPLLAPDLTPGEHLTATRRVAERGLVLGQGGTPLVEVRPVTRVGVDKQQAAEAGVDPAEAARALAAALGTDADALAQRVAAAGPQAFVEAIVLRDGDTTYDTGVLDAIPGVGTVGDELPLALTRTFARAILGSVGAATAEIVEASQGAVVAGDMAGLSGLQRQYDAQLRGTPGALVEAVADGTGATRVLLDVPPVAGEPLRTTLDPALQQRAEAVLAGVAPASAIVALRPSTGEVLAAANGPGSEGLSTATVGQYAPGSTFKVVSTLAYLRGGLTPESTVSCLPSITVDGRTFQNFPGYPAAALGDVPFRTAFAHSCNTAFIGSRDLAEDGALLAAARSLGLEPDADLSFPAFLGTVPDDASATAHAASVIGQGEVLASPLGMATVAASVGAGRTVVPVLVADDEQADGPTGPADPTEPADAEPADDATALPAAEPLTSAEAEALRTMMRAVVTEGGGTVLADVPGEPVLAKTGTAQFGQDADLRNHAWMIAVQGDLAVAVFVGEGDFGSTTAGPLLRSFLAG